MPTTNGSFSVTASASQPQRGRQLHRLHLRERDGTGQYQFNWGSPKNGAGYYWRIAVKLDDGTIQAVNLGLR